MEPAMPAVVRAVIRNGRIEPVEPLNVSEGTEVLVTVPLEGEGEEALCRLASHASLHRAWDESDDVYDALAEG